MSMFWPYVALLAVLGALVLFSQRRRRRQLAEEMVRLNRLGVGSAVMTTSGLYATVVARNDDGTAQLEIAPGVVVTWAWAALRDAAALPDQYRRGTPGEENPPEQEYADPTS